MIRLVVITFLLDAALSQYWQNPWDWPLNRCDDTMVKFYRELGCKPLYDWRYFCPALYDCTDIEQARKGWCHLNGMFFAEGDKLEGSNFGLNCYHCQCTSQYGLKKWMCAIEDCAYWPTGAGCRPMYLKGQCCPKSKICDTSPIPRNTFVCLIDGVTYVENETVPSPPSSCKSCSCQRGYDGSQGGPWCQDSICGFELLHLDQIQQGCAPVFNGQDGCCPIYFKCQSPQDRVIPASGSCASVNAQCIYGSLRLNINDKLESPGGDNCVTCSCFIPPYVTCSRQPGCY